MVQNYYVGKKAPKIEDLLQEFIGFCYLCRFLGKGVAGCANPMICMEVLCREGDVKKPRSHTMKDITSKSLLGAPSNKQNLFGYDIPCVND